MFSKIFPNKKSKTKYIERALAVNMCSKFKIDNLKKATWFYHFECQKGHLQAISGELGTFRFFPSKFGRS